MENRESLRKKVGKFIALVVIVFTLTTAVVITQKLSSDALALIVGVTLGLVAMVPTLGLGWLVWRREVTRVQTSPMANPPSSPSIIVVTPQALPYGGQRAALESYQNGNLAYDGVPSERKFTIVGGEE